ncbi:MAG: PIN domain-containing protein [Spirochaetota bacterium]
MSKHFIDTNVIVYANDSANPDKQERAIECVSSHMRDGTGVLSTQVLMEYTAVAVSKLGQKREVVTAQLDLLDRLEVVQVNGALIRRALELLPRFSLSFWDAVILSAAITARCPVLLTEDLSHGQTLAGVEVRNPFL